MQQSVHESPIKRGDAKSKITLVTNEALQLFGVPLVVQIWNVSLLEKAIWALVTLSVSEATIFGVGDCVYHWGNRTEATQHNWYFLICIILENGRC